MNNTERTALMSALLADYQAAYGPRKSWSRYVVDKFHTELGIMAHAVIILREAGILPPVSQTDSPQ